MKTPILDGIRKQSGISSEIGGGILWSPLAVPAGLIGLISKKMTEEQMAAQKEKDWSNLIPGLAAYRLGRRIKHEG